MLVTGTLKRPTKQESWTSNNSSAIAQSKIKNGNVKYASIREMRVSYILDVSTALPCLNKLKPSPTFRCV